jgi:hypothetical protein
MNKQIKWKKPHTAAREAERERVDVWLSGTTITQGLTSHH